jgi:nitroimidazol reductase NimA-like FMN-containing flavoprotein (pyridoxamine 5'-phosphate oxidase superfamily)
MRIADARTGIEVLDRAACLLLLADDVVGRLAFVDGGAPAIVVVNYVLDGDAVVFRSGPGTKLRTGVRAPVAFEIDRLDRESRSGWSVVVTGRLEEVTDHRSTLLQRVQALPIDPWAEGDKPHLLRLVPTAITGRRVARDR